jgi:protein-tyrosine-phosphatase
MYVSQAKPIAVSPSWASIGLVFALVTGCTAPARPGHAEVMFVCEHGAAKSVVAMAYFNKLAAERGLDVRAVARGADPQDSPSTSATEGLQADGLRPSLDPPRPLTASEIRGSARVIAFDCHHGAMTALQGMDACWDDVPATADDYARARDIIRAHVSAVIDELVAHGAASPSR